jgi:hypothetical protein
MTFSRSCVQSFLTAVASFQDLNFCLATKFLSRKRTAVLFKKAKDILRYPVFPELPGISRRRVALRESCKRRVLPVRAAL